MYFTSHSAEILHRQRAAEVAAAAEGRRRRKEATVAAAHRGLQSRQRSESLVKRTVRHMGLARTPRTV